MPHGGTLCCHITAHRGQNGRDGGTDVGAEHKRAGQVVANPALAAHNQCDGEGGRRRLYYHCQQQANQQEYQYGGDAHRGVMFQVGEHVGVALQVGHVGANHVQTHEQEAETYKEFTHALGLALVGQQQHYCHGNKRHHKSGDVDFESEQGYNPCCKGGTYVGTHYHCHRLSQGHQAGIHETYHHYSGGR
jgi:hypothetical protein